jgi:rhodanese-related sulfurtransferase
MSWNAAKRAAAIGYSNVAWFPEGTDGWLAAILPLQDATPEPRPSQ